MRKLIPVLLCAALIVGCNASNVAEKAYSVIDAVLTVAQAETSLVPQQDQAAYIGFVTLGQSLTDQLDACIKASGNGKAKLLACFNGYATGLSSPAEMVQLRILNPATQKRVQLYLTAIVTGVNVAVAAFGGTQSAAPSIAPAPSKAELKALASRIGV